MAFADVTLTGRNQTQNDQFRRRNLSRTNNLNSPMQSNTPDYELEASSLFEKHTVEEVRGIEKKTRADIEKKKEELRVMVGERYRDLIDAADTISEMTTSASNVFKSISHMESLCKNLKQNFLVHGFTTRNQPPQRQVSEESVFHGIASQIKLLLDMPEKMWSAVEGGDLLLASRLFLLSRHIHTGLYLETTQSTAILSWFPVVTRQWSAIGHFKNTILQSCRELIQQADASDESVTEALCSIMLLEDTPPKTILSDFLHLRTVAIGTLLRADSEQTSIKNQICTVVALISHTIHQVYSLFYNEPSPNDRLKCNLLLQKVTEVTSKTSLEAGLVDRSGSVSARCLPKSVTDYRPIVPLSADSLPVTYIQQLCQNWCTECIEDVKESVNKLLHYVNCVKRLADIRDAVCTLLTEDGQYDTWDQVCGVVLTSPLNIWATFLQALFIHRIQELISYQVESTTEITKRHIGKVVIETTDVADSNEHDLSTYIWTESSTDIPASMAWLSASNKSLGSGGGLMMKAWAFTPTIQSLCGEFDEKFGGLLGDVQHYLRPTGIYVTEDQCAFDRFSDDGAIVRHMQTTGIECIKRLVAYVKEELRDWKASLGGDKDSTSCQIILKKVLLVGRFCTACYELTSHLSQCILGPDYKEQRQLKHSIHRGRSSRFGEGTPWHDMRHTLADAALVAHSIWSDYTLGSLLDTFSSSILSNQTRDVLMSFTQWEEIEISEDTEEGQAIKSTIRVPMQASWSLQKCLYDACKEINTVSAHILPRNVLQGLVYGLTDGILHHINALHDKLTRPAAGCLPLTQQRALQLLFDVKFLLTIIPRKEDHEGNKKYQETGRRLVEQLEDKVDPFDLDVFSPYIQTNLNNQSRRAMIVYGAVMCVDRHSFHGTTVSSHQQQHNVLPLAACAPRFPLLPLSTDTTRVNFTHRLPPPKLSKLSDTSGQSLAASAEAVIESVRGSSSTQDAVGSFYNRIGSMSQIWFSNIGAKS